MKKIVALFLVLALAVGVFAGCAANTPAGTEGATGGIDDHVESSPASSTPADTTPVANSELKIGIILVGDENEGYSYAHIEGIEAALAATGLSKDNIIYKYNIPEDETCHDTAVDLADAGCQLIISNSYSHQSFMQQAAAEYPDKTFVACTGDGAASSGLANFKNAFPFTFESRYVSGVVAGMKLKELMDAGTVKDPYIGYVGAYPYAEVVSGYTAFFLGVRSIVPEAHMDVMYTNSWFDMTAEANAADALMARGCVIIGQHADSTGAPSAVQAQLSAGKTVYSVGYNVDMLSVAPDAALTSAQNNWSVFYTYAFNCLKNGEEIVTDWAHGYEDGAVMISALGGSCAAGTAEKVAEVEAAIKDGSLKVFDTSTWTVNGEHLTSYTNVYGFEGNEMISDGYFHESELRSAPAFDVRIDGITELS